MNWKKEQLHCFKLYAVTDLKTDDGELLDRLDRALQNGVDVIQLRSKVLPDRILLEVSQEIRKLTLRRKKLFFVNDRVDLALAAGADGVHLGEDDLAISFARALAGKKEFLIGKSTHNLEQARQAEKEGADYIGFGPIFETPTKPDYPAVGLKEISKLKQMIRIPFVCIGGIDESKVEEVLEAGAERVAVVRAIFGQSDTGLAAKRLRERIDQWALRTP